MRRNALQPNRLFRSPPDFRFCAEAGRARLRALRVIADAEAAVSGPATRSSDSDLMAAPFVLRASGSGSKTGQYSNAVSRNEIGTRRKALPNREVADALPEKPHYKTQLDDRGGASIIVNGDLGKAMAGAFGTPQIKFPIDDGGPLRLIFGGQSRRAGR
jgi:hypothetical protein